MKQELIARCDAPELDKKRSMTVEKALRAICYIGDLEKRTTRFPTMVCRQLDKVLEIISRSIVELEVRVQHAQAKNEVVENNANRQTKR